MSDWNDRKPPALAMRLVKRPRANGPQMWEPFAEPHDAFTGGWWDDPWRFQYATDRRWFVARLGDAEVCRVEVEIGVADDYYVGAQILGNRRILGIEFLDVASTHRRHGVGTLVVRLLERRFGDHRLVAFSEDADSFWCSLGWDRIVHPSGDRLYRPLFVQPAH